MKIMTEKEGLNELKRLIPEGGVFGCSQVQKLLRWGYNRAARTIELGIKSGVLQSVGIPYQVVFKDGVSVSHIKEKTKFDDIVEEAVEKLKAALDCIGTDGLFQIVPGESLLGPKVDDVASIEFEIKFKYGNCEHSHHILIGWNEEDGVGIEQGEDSEIQSISYGSIMTVLYFDLALTGLDEKYLN